MILALLKRSDIKPNIQNKQKMAALHCAAREGRKKILEILVRDPRVDTALQELNGWTFLNYLNLNPSCKKLKNDAFGRITVDTFVNKEVETLYRLIINNLLTINLTHEDMQRSRKIIQNNITNVAKKQSTKHKDRELSSSAIIPEYISDQVIEWMIRWRLFYLNEATLSQLDQAILLQQTLADIKKDEKLPVSLNTTTSLPLNQPTLLQQTLTDIKQYEELPEHLNTLTPLNQALLLQQTLAEQKEEKLPDYL